MLTVSKVATNTWIDRCGGEERCRQACDSGAGFSGAFVAFVQWDLARDRLGVDVVLYLREWLYLLVVCL